MGSGMFGNISHKSLPFNIVNNEQFFKLFYFFDANFKLLTRQAVSEKWFQFAEN